MSSAARMKERTCPRCNKTFTEDAAFCPNDGAPLEPPPSGPVGETDHYIGTVIHGDIEIRAVAGAGAMGRVYRAHQKGIERDVAVKILHRELSGNHALVQRFHREAKIASKLQHPHVVEVYLAGQLADGSLYMVMEYLDGLSLAAATQASAGLMTLERALPIALQICDAVGEGHSRGIVHRDLKPENVMLVRRADTSDWVKVLDFGIAKVNLGDQSMETAAGLIFGTARYISPEGAQGATVGPPGDVYSIAVILYQLLSGKTPFDAEQPVGMLIKHIHEQPPRLRSWPAAANIPEAVERVIMENLGKEPGQRAPTARALGNALASAAKEAQVVFSDVGVVARMSIVDVAAPSKRPLDRTLDDVAAQPPVFLPNNFAPIQPSLSPLPRSLSPAQPSLSPVPSSTPPAPKSTDALAATTADVSAREIIPRHVSSSGAPLVVPPHESPHPPQPRKTSPLFVLLAFMLGVALTALVMQYVSQRPEREHQAHVARTRRALANGRYTDPPGDNVRDLVASGLQQWPDDADLTRIQSDAAHEIVTRAMAARSGGDVSGARDLAKTASELDPTDGTAKLLLAQYEDEMAAEVDGGGGALGAPHVVLEVPIGRARPGGRAELIAHISAAPHHEIKNAQFVISGPGLEKNGLRLAAIGDRERFSAVFSPPREGDYEVQFEANVAGASVRADRMLAVTR